MDKLLLYAIEQDGLQPLVVPDDVSAFAGLYKGLDLGVYSALRTFNHNKFLHLQHHLDRTQQSVDLMDWDYPIDQRRLRQALDSACSAAPWPEMRVRFDILARPATPLGTTSRELVALKGFKPLPEAIYQTGVRVALSEDLHRDRPLAKSAAFAALQPAGHTIEYAGSTAPYEQLLTDDQGAILEGTGSNFYGIRDGAILTAGHGILEGVTRHIILSLAEELGIPIILEPLHRDQLDSLDEAALSSSSRALLPVVEIEGIRISDGRPGPISRQLLAAYQAYVSHNIKRAI